MMRRTRISQWPRGRAGRIGADAAWWSTAASNSEVADLIGEGRNPVSIKTECRKEFLENI